MFLTGEGALNPDIINFSALSSMSYASELCTSEHSEHCADYSGSRHEYASKKVFSKNSRS